MGSQHFRWLRHALDSDGFAYVRYAVRTIAKICGATASLAAGLLRTAGLDPPPSLSKVR